MNSLLSLCQGKIVSNFLLKKVLNYLFLSKCHGDFTHDTIPFPTFYHYSFPLLNTIIVLLAMTSLKKPLSWHCEDYFFYYIHFPAKNCFYCTVSAETLVLKTFQRNDHVNVSYNNPQRRLGLPIRDIIMVGKCGT